jgi:hypothetical protein
MDKNGNIYDYISRISPASNKEQNPPQILTAVKSVFGKFYTVLFQTVAACNLYLATSAAVVL